MIEDVVQESYRKFQERWRYLSERNAVLSLQGTWPSVGVVDLLTNGTRGVRSLSEEADELIRGASAYLAVLAYHCWASFGVAVVVDRDDTGVIIRAKGGEFIPEGREFLIHIEREIRKILKDQPRELPVFGSFSRILAPDQNFLSLFGIGLMTGLSSYGEGPWLNEGPDTFKTYIEKSKRVLARSSAEYYKDVFPDEIVGSVPELYLNDLIYPPTLMEELLPACRAVKGIVQFFKDYNFTKEQMLVLAHNLSLSPDELISLAGLACYAAVATALPPAIVVAAARAKGSFMGPLRQAMLDVRAELGLERDWLRQEVLTPEDAFRIELEYEFGFLPWVRLSLKKIKDGKLAELVDALVRFEFNAAVGLCDSIIDEMPGEIEVRIQRIALDMINGDFEEGRNKARALLTEPGCEQNPVIYNQLGLCELNVGDTEQAEKMLAAAHRLIGPSTPEPHNITNDYSWLLVLTEEFDRALEVVEIAIAGDPCPVTPLLNKAYILLALGREHECRKIEKKLIELAPTDVRVISNCMLNG